MTLRIYYNSEYLREIETLYENTSALDYLIMGPNGWEQWKTEGKKISWFCLFKGGIQYLQIEQETPDSAAIGGLWLQWLVTRWDYPRLDFFANGIMEK